MADNTTFQSTTPATPPAGLVVAGDLVGGALYQRIKPTHGADGTATDTSAAAPLPVAPGTPSTAALSGAAVNASASGANTIVAGVGGQTIRIFRLFLVASAAVTITLMSGSSALTGPIALSAGGAIVLDFDGEPWFITGDGEDFILSLSDAVQVSGRVYCTQG